MTYCGVMIQHLTPRQQLRAGHLGRRLAQLFLGLSTFGVGNALMYHSGLGMDPWNVLHQGIASHVPLSLGAIIVVVSLLVMLAWIPLKQWPGIGTISNAIWIGVATDIAIPMIPSATGWAAAAAYSAAGVVLIGVSIALYIGAMLGPGPRDGLMTGLSARTGRSIRFVRTCLEITVLAAGWLLGGVFGVGTVVFALAVGPIVQATLPYVTYKPHNGR